MARSPILSPAGLVALSLAIGAAGCVRSPAQPTGKGGGKPTVATASTSPVPTTSSGAPTPSPRPTGALPVASPTATPAPSSLLSTAHQALQTALEAKLVAISQVAFTQQRAHGAFSGEVLLVSDYGAGIISNHAGGLIGDGGGNLIGDGGGNLISNNSGSYRLAAAETTILTVAAEGEEKTEDRVFLDGTRAMVFVEGHRRRQIEINAAGQPLHEIDQDVTAYYPGDIPKVQVERQKRLLPDGRFVFRSQAEFEVSETGEPLSAVLVGDDNRAIDPYTGASIKVESYAADLKTGQGHFRIAFPSLGLVEDGVLEGIALTSENKIEIDLAEPLKAYAGHSDVFDATGKLVFKKHFTGAGDTQVREYDLGNGLTMRLKPGNDGAYAGDVFQNGVKEAEVKQEKRTGGTTVFLVAFPEDPTHPLITGFGLKDAAPLPAASPTPFDAQGAIVTSRAGAYEAGDATGPGDVARFNQLSMLVRSQVDPTRFYVADSNNHRVRLLRRAADGHLDVETYAGTGEPGIDDGFRQAARFVGPAGLAVGPDDTLYVSELGTHRIRVITPAGTVSVLAGGSDTGNFRDGVGTAARFNGPVGLTLDGEDLYVADQSNHCVRRVKVSGPDRGKVAIYAGNGIVGHQDGPVAQATFDGPFALAVDDAHRLYVTDTGNDRVRRIDPDGTVSTVVGGDADAPPYDGPALQRLPRGVGSLLLGPGGELYIGGIGVYALMPDGQLRSVAGVGHGSSDGGEINAAFEAVIGLAFTQEGTLLSADRHRVREIAFAPSPSPSTAP